MESHRDRQRCSTGADAFRRASSKLWPIMLKHREDRTGVSFCQVIFLAIRSYFRLFKTSCQEGSTCLEETLVSGSSRRLAPVPWNATDLSNIKVGGLQEPENYLT